MNKAKLKQSHTSLNTLTTNTPHVNNSSLVINTASISSNSSSSSSSSSTSSSSSSSSSSSGSCSQTLNENQGQTTAPNGNSIQSNSRLKRSPSASCMQSPESVQPVHGQKQSVHPSNDSSASLPASSIIKILNKTLASSSNKTLAKSKQMAHPMTNDGSNGNDLVAKQADDSSSSNLKKAISMISLFNTQLKQQQLTTNKFASSVVKSTSRQIKQRSTERQLTCSSILSNNVTEHNSNSLR